MFFVFVQMYFIFLNQKMNIYKNKFISRFGLMHMIATNLCVWFNVLILETSHEIMEGRHHASLNQTSYAEHLKAAAVGSHDPHELHGDGLHDAGHHENHENHDAVAAVREDGHGPPFFKWKDMGGRSSRHLSFFNLFVITAT